MVFPDLTIHGITTNIVLMYSLDLIHIYRIVNSTAMNSTGSGSARQTNYTCKICSRTFENLGDLQRHSTVEHMQKGEVHSDSQTT